jgi:ribosomal protein S18 acetylase RimI-like enzyme
MEIKIVHNRQDVYDFLKNKCRYDYLYQFYDLEEGNWKNVICYGLYDGEELKQIAVMSINYGIPVLLAAIYQEAAYNIELLKRIKSFLPPKFYTHIDIESLKAVFGEDKINDLEEYVNMGLIEEFSSDNTTGVVQLGYEQIEDIKGLLAVSYPEAWLDDELVKLNRNFGVYCDNKLISFAGIHAYSEEFQVAAIAHVTTHPDFRRKGYGEKVVQGLVGNLRSAIKYIGLNVRVNNLNAINCYQKQGFKKFGKFMACEIEILKKA